MVESYRTEVRSKRKKLINGGGPKACKVSRFNKSSHHFGTPCNILNV